MVDGVKVVYNKNEPTKPKFDYKLTEAAIIPFIVEDKDENRNMKSPGSLTMDKDGNLFVGCFKSARIYKFDSSFNFLKSFAGKGPGPGEYVGAPSSLNIVNGKILAPCSNVCTTNIYDTNGEFIKKIPPKIVAGFGGQKAFNNQLIMNVEKRELVDDKRRFTSKINLIDSNIENIEKTIYTHVHDVDGDVDVMPLSDMYIRYVGSKDMLYIGDVSSVHYKIYGFDKNLNKIMEIRKDYLPQEDTDPEALVYGFSEGSLGGGFYRKNNTSWENKKHYFKAINQMFVDKYERLWVISAYKNSDKKSGLYADIFENGIYLNTIHLAFFKEELSDLPYYRLYIQNDKIIYIDSDEEVIKIFDYEEVI